MTLKLYSQPFLPKLKNNNYLRVPEIQLRRKCTGFTYCGAKIFNNLPNNIRETQDKIIFKKLVKNWIWDEVPSY